MKIKLKNEKIKQIKNEKLKLEKKAIDLLVKEQKEENKAQHTICEKKTPIDKKHMVIHDFDDFRCSGPKRDLSFQSRQPDFWINSLNIDLFCLYFSKQNKKGFTSGHYNSQLWQYIGHFKNGKPHG